MKKTHYALTFCVLLLSACGSGSSSTTDDNSSDSTTTFNTPSILSSALAEKKSISWEVLSSSPANLTHFSMSELNNDDIIVISDSNTTVDAALTVDSGMKTEISVSLTRLLNGMFEFIETSTSGVYYIKSMKHSNYALDINSSSSDVLNIRDIRSLIKDTSSSAYLLFTVSSSGEGYILTASGRMVYDTTSSSFVSDSTWVAKTVVYSNNTLELSTSSSSVLSLYKEPIDLTIPSDFNPDPYTRVDNAEATPIEKDDIPSTLPSKILDAYADQVTATGLNDATTTTATTMLSTIKTTLESEGASMRYTADFYLAFRAGLLTRRLGAADSTDGTLGQLTNPYVYFTNPTDSSDVHHPFMVIVGYGLPESLALLWDVARPPGDGAGSSGYAGEGVTRSFHREGFVLKIPMKDYGEVSSLTENTLTSSLADDEGVTDYDNFNYTSTSSTGVAIDGVVVYPSYNNQLHFSQTEGELSAQGMHSGKGLGVHYHADAHSAANSGMNLYNDLDYVGKTHPPIISMGFDGVAGYGRYKDGDTTSDGASVALDAYGGHEHDGYGYHYHAYTRTETTTIGQVSFTEHTFPPQGAWGGKINDIPAFLKTTSPDDIDENAPYLGIRAN